jgi:putative FmdB family regulatory protein
MPIYTVTCKDCGEYEDILRNFYEDHIDNCACGGQRRKVFNIGGVSFRGNGFYRTDSQTNAPKED